MSDSNGNKRTTVYLDPKVHRALKLKAAEGDRTISDIVNESVRRTLNEDLIDVRSLNSRKGEPDRPLDEFIQEITKSGLL